ncbi:hypothetical protein CK503_01710 [Aliifodinibius salipaludis]|uniref:PAS domain S-box protein n=1 Tax=Fodinibius salipaludis TaxID=2032627 RepID=A0A2A2GF24_9BACT|nr:PAS domain S-box protein [Aliifodinibius salipaludis]PAU95800.1 hypothetical protein CK503_01710 [Aliifodinibius salipaludis]
MSQSNISDMGEKERLGKLAEYNLTDRDIEEELNNLVTLASKICETPISLINVLGANTQFTKASVGWDITKISREESFCHHTIQDHDIMIVENAIEDERFTESPLVEGEPHIRFYAGVPLKTNEGHNIGAICVIDREERSLTSQQKESLKMISKEVVSRFELIKKNAQLKKADILLQNSSDIQAIIDPDSLKYLEVNNETLSLLSCSKSELDGKRFGERIVDEDLRDEVRTFLSEPKNVEGSFVVRFLSKEEEVVKLKLSFTFYQNRWYMTGRDISRRDKVLQELESEKLFSDNIINNLPGLFCLTDEDGILQRWNKNFKQLVGKSNSEIEDSALFDHFAEDDSELLEIAFKQVLATGEGEAEGNLKTKEQGLIPYALTSFQFTMDDRNYIACIGVDISDLRETQDKLRHTLTNMRIGQELADLGSWRWDLKNNSLLWSPKVYDIYDIDNVAQKPSVELFKERVHPEDISIIDDITNRIKSGEPFQDFEHRLLISDDKVRWVRHSGKIMYEDDGSISHVIGAVQDITSQVKAKQKLEKEKALSDKIINSLPISFFMFDQHGNAIRWNDYFRKATGFNDMQISYMDPLDYFPEKHKERVSQAIERVFEEGKASIQAEFLTSSGELVPYLYSASRFQGDQITYLIGTGQDISEIKEYQNELDQSLKEKEVLLTEIHHRVKNNLAIISGLLQLEAFSAENDHTKNILKNSQMRIQSMATIHEMLYEAENFNDLSFDSFVEQVTSSVREVYNTAGNNDISFDISIDAINLNINQAVPCGLIINELVTNAYKHAFPNHQDGRIEINGNKVGSSITFVIEDNGRGLPDDFSIDEQNSLGFSLVSSLIDQLGATLDIRRDDGAIFIFSFEQENVRGAGSSISGT